MCVDEFSLNWVVSWCSSRFSLSDIRYLLYLFIFMGVWLSLWIVAPSVYNITSALFHLFYIFFAFTFIGTGEVRQWRGPRVGHCCKVWASGHGNMLNQVGTITPHHMITDMDCASRRCNVVYKTHLHFHHLHVWLKCSKMSAKIKNAFDHLFCLTNSLTKDI